MEYTIARHSRNQTEVKSQKSEEKQIPLPPCGIGMTFFLTCFLDFLTSGKSSQTENKFIVSCADGRDSGWLPQYRFRSHLRDAAAVAGGESLLYVGRIEKKDLSWVVGFDTLRGGILRKVTGLWAAAAEQTGSCDS